MKIRGSAPVGHPDADQYTNIPLLEISVSNDRVEKHGMDTIKRTIDGHIKRKEEYWNEYLKIWSQHGGDVFPELHVKDLIVEFDWYTPDGVIRIGDDDSITLVLLESFEKPLDQFPAELSARNVRRQDLENAILAGRGAFELMNQIDPNHTFKSDAEINQACAERITGMKWRFNLLV